MKIKLTPTERVELKKQISFWKEDMMLSYDNWTVRTHPYKIIVKFNSFK